MTETLGPIEVLQYSPLPQKDFMRPVLETTPADLTGPIEFSIYGPVAAVHQVLPGMRFLPEGSNPSILFVNGGSAVKPGRNVTGTSVAFAGQAAYAQLLHEVLGEEGIYVGQLIIGGRIIEGDEEKDPAVLADHLWELHTKRDTFRTQVAEGLSRPSQGMSAGLRTSSSVLRSFGAPVAVRSACGSLTESSRESAARVTVEPRSPR